MLLNSLDYCYQQSNCLIESRITFLLPRSKYVWSIILSTTVLKTNYHTKSQILLSMLFSTDNYHSWGHLRHLDLPCTILGFLFKLFNLHNFFFFTAVYYFNSKAKKHYSEFVVLALLVVYVLGCFVYWHFAPNWVSTVSGIDIDLSVGLIPQNYCSASDLRSICSSTVYLPPAVFFKMSTSQKRSYT